MFKDVFVVGCGNGQDKNRTLSTRDKCTDVGDTGETTRSLFSPYGDGVLET